MDPKEIQSKFDLMVADLSPEEQSKLKNLSPEDFETVEADFLSQINSSPSAFSQIGDVADRQELARQHGQDAAGLFNEVDTGTNLFSTADPVATDATGFGPGARKPDNVDRTRGMEDLIEPGAFGQALAGPLGMPAVRAFSPLTPEEASTSLVRFALESEPTIEGKISIISRQGLRHAFSDEGELVLMDPEGKMVSIDAVGPSFMDLAAFGPEMANLALEIFTDVKMAKSPGETIEVVKHIKSLFPKGTVSLPSTAAAATGVKSLLARSTVAGLAGLAGSSALQGISAIGGGKDGMSTGEIMSENMMRGGAQGLFNALGFGAVEAFGRGVRKGTRFSVRRPSNTPGDKEAHEQAVFFRELGLDGDLMLDARPAMTLAAKNKLESVKTVGVIQDELDQSANDLWKPLFIGRNGKPRIVDYDLEKMKGYSEYMNNLGDESIGEFGDEVIAKQLKMSSIVDNVIAGGQIKKDLIRFSEELPDHIRRDYDTIGETIGGSTGKTTNSSSEVLSILRDLEGVSPSVEVNRLKRILRQFEPKDVVPEGIAFGGGAEEALAPGQRMANKLFPEAGILGQPEIPSMSYDNLKRISTDLGKDIDWKTTWGVSETDKLGKQLYKAMRKDMMAIAERDAPELVDVIKKANADFSDAMDFLDNPIWRLAKETKTPSMLRGAVFATKENVQGMKRIIKDPAQRRDISSGIVRDAVGLSDNQVLSDLNVNRARQNIQDMKRGKKGKGGGVWQEIFNDTDGVFSSKAGLDIEMLIEETGKEQLRRKARKSFFDSFQGDFSNVLKVSDNMGKLRNSMAIMLRSNDISKKEYDLMNKMMVDIEVEGGTELLRQKFKGVGEDIDIMDIFTKKKASAEDILSKVGGFINELPADQRNAIMFGDDLNTNKQFASFLEPEELERLSKVHKLAMAKHKIDFNDKSLKQLQQEGVVPQINVPVGGMQYAAFLAAIRKHLLGSQISRVLSPNQIAKKQGIRHTIRDFVRRGISNTVEHPDSRNLELAGQLGAKHPIMELFGSGESTPSIDTQRR